MRLIVHSSLSRLGPVAGGATTVVDSLRAAVGLTGTVVTPAFTPRITDPAQTCVGPPDAALRAQRAAVPVFHTDLPCEMGAVATFGRLHSLDGHILLIGVGHNRNSFLRHAETLTPQPRATYRRTISAIKRRQSPPGGRMPGVATGRYSAVRRAKEAS